MCCALPLSSYLYHIKIFLINSQLFGHPPAARIFEESPSSGQLMLVRPNEGLAVGTVVVDVHTRVHAVRNTNAGPAPER